MKKLKKVVLSTLATGIIMAIPLVSCSRIIHYYPQDLNIDINLMSNSVAFSNWTLASALGASYSLSVSGDTQNGDTILVSIGEQICDGKEVNFIKLSEDSILHTVTKSETNFTVLLNTVVKENHDIFVVKFSLFFQVIRNQTTIIKKEVPNFTFVNGTPTPENFFDKIIGEDSVRVIGFATDKATQEQLKLCNIFVLPQGTTEVDSQAFEVYPIPSWIQRAYLDYSELDPSFTPTLRRILPRAFAGCAINNRIVLHSSLELVASGAFAGCTGVSSIELHRKDITIGQSAFSHIPGVTELDLSIYRDHNEMPEAWSSQCFLKDVAEGNSMICYYNKQISEYTWINFLTTLDIDTTNWHFKQKNR